MTTFNLNNANKNAPLWWKRLESGLLIGLVPAFTGFVTAIPIADHEKVYALAGAGFFCGIIKFVGILMGETENKDESNV